jgi:hypothetical protein
VLQAKVPWAEPGSRFTAHFEALAVLVFRVTLFQEHFFMIKAGAVTMIPGRRGERDVFGG